jgi:hypothetical protein
MSENIITVSNDVATAYFEKGVAAYENKSYLESITCFEFSPCTPVMKKNFPVLKSQ